jgi:hypothetical protein
LCSANHASHGKEIISDEAWSVDDSKIVELTVNDLHQRYDGADVLRDIYRRMFDFVLQAKLKTINRP